jgi:hypothetical protein
VPEMDLIIDSGDATGGSSPRVAPPLPSTLSVALSINGDPVNAEVDTRLTLLDFLRERARLTGTKKGCNRGECGTCTLLVDGRRVNACMILMASLEGRRVTTIEGLDQGRASSCPGGVHRSRRFPVWFLYPRSDHVGRRMH